MILIGMSVGAIADINMGGETRPLICIDMNRLDYYDIHPDGMDAYLSNYGYHFSKKLCEFAVSKMKDRNGNRLKMREKIDIDSLLESHGIRIENDKAYDAVYVFHMACSDFVGSSLTDEAAAAKYVKDVLDDYDGYDGIAFTRFVADCNGKGLPIIWSDVI